MPLTKEQKTEILEKLTQKFGDSKSVTFAQYRSLDVAKVSDLRKKLREKGSEMMVAKKTLIGLAADKNGLGEIDPSYMEGPIAVIFSLDDAISGIKAASDFSKKNEGLTLLGGVVDGKIVGPEVIKQYADLPGREELIAKLIGSMNSPVSGTVGLLGNLISGFVRVLNAYKDTKPAEEAEVKEEPKVEEKAEEKAAAELTDSAEANQDKSEEPKAEASTSEETAPSEAGGVDSDQKAEEAEGESKKENGGESQSAEVGEKEE